MPCRLENANRGANGEFQKLTIDGYNLYDINNNQWNTNGFTATQQTLGFSLAGTSVDGALNYQGESSYYWSSTFYGGYDMYSLLFDEYDSNPADAFYRDFGGAIRCIAQ